SQPLTSEVISTLPLSCGPQEKTPAIPPKPALWAVSSSGLFGWARPYVYLSDHLVRPKQHDRWDREPEGLGRLQVDDQLELGGLLPGQFGRRRAFENFVHVGGDALPLVALAGAIAHEITRLGKSTSRADRRQPVLCRKGSNLRVIGREEGV